MYVSQVFNNGQACVEKVGGFFVVVTEDCKEHRVEVVDCFNVLLSQRIARNIVSKNVKVKEKNQKV